MSSTEDHSYFLVLKVLCDRLSDSSIFRGRVLTSRQDVASSLWGTAEPHSRWPSLQQTKTTQLTSAFADCHESLQRNRQEGKLLTQVCALKVKHFHLCNKIAEAGRRSSTQPSWGQSKTLRSTKWWMAVPLILRHDWLCLLGHSGAGCVKWSPLCGALAQPQLWCRR